MTRIPTATAAIRTQRRKAALSKASRAARNRKNIDPAYDFAEAEINSEVAIQEQMIDHYAELEKAAGSEKGKSRWRHLRRLAQKMKDDLVAIYYRYEERRSLRDLAAAVYEAQKERREQIEWLALHGEEAAHTERAQREINILQTFLLGILHHIRDANPGRPIAAEAAYVLATVKTH